MHARYFHTVPFPELFEGEDTLRAKYFRLSFCGIVLQQALSGLKGEEAEQ